VTPEMLALIDRALAGDAPMPVSMSSDIPNYYGVGATAEDVYQQWVIMAERMIPLKPQDERFYRGALRYWDRRRRGEDVGPVPNTGPVRGGVVGDVEECAGCQ